MKRNSRGNFIEIRDGWRGDPNLVATKNGRCHYAQCQVHTSKSHPTRLKDHYVKNHYAPMAPAHILNRVNGGKTWIYDYIPEDGVDDAKLIKCGRGLMCNICKQAIQGDLRQHFNEKHSNIRVPCGICGKTMAKSSLINHLATHTPPAKCFLCPAQLANKYSIKRHFYNCHKGVRPDKKINWRHLDEAETEEYEILCEERRERSLSKHRSSNEIKCMKTTMEEYQRRIKDPKDPLCMARERVRNDFARFFRVSQDLVTFHASYASWWNKKWKIPGLVFEILQKQHSGERWTSTNFYQDPSVDYSTQPTNEEYAGHDGTINRGHWASAADFDELMFVLATYYYVNIAPFIKEFNKYTRLHLEKFLRAMADKVLHPIFVFHFPIFYGEPEYMKGTRVRIPTAVATVAVEEIKVKDGIERKIAAWELWNNSEIQPLKGAVRNPFCLMKKAGILEYFNFEEKDFAVISQDAQK